MEHQSVPLPAAVQRQPGQVFHDYTAKPTYDKPELTLPIASEEVLLRGPTDLLKGPSHDPFLGFDREDLSLTPPGPAGSGGGARSGKRRKWCRDFPRRIDGEIVLPAGLGRLATGGVSGFRQRLRISGASGRDGQLRSRGCGCFFRDYLAKTAFAWGAPAPWKLPGRGRTVRESGRPGSRNLKRERCRTIPGDPAGGDLSSDASGASSGRHAHLGSSWDWRPGILDRSSRPGNCRPPRPRSSGHRCRPLSPCQMGACHPMPSCFLMAGSRRLGARAGRESRGGGSKPER